MNKYGLFTLVILGWQASVFSWLRPNMTTDCDRNRTTPTTPKVEVEKEYPSNIEFGGDYSYVTLQPKGHATFHGNLGGAQAIYEYKAKRNIYGAARLAWKQGNTRSSGADRFLRIIDTQERLGYSFGSVAKERMLTLYSGLGFRYLGQKLNPRHGKTVHFNYSEFYVPVGFITYGTLTSRFTLGAAFAWMPQIFPTVTITPRRGAHWSLKDRINNYFAELIFDFALNRSKWAHLIFRPFYERWQDGPSTARTSSGLKLGLPGNTYNFWGIDINLAFYF